MMNAFEFTSERLDHQHLAAHLGRLPKRFRPSVNRKYVEIYEAHGRQAANLALMDISAQMGGNRSLLAASDAELCEFAKARAEECFRAATRYLDADMALTAMREVARAYGINPPDAEKIKPQGQRARLLCDLWWRRQVRKTIARQVEKAAIGLGIVSKRAGIYASDETVARRAGQRKRNAAILEAMIAVNDEGQEYTLAQLSALGVSNPEIRRMELMTRLAGFDAYAKHLGHAAEFYTITAPSRFHAVRSDGKHNPKYTAESPRAAQAHLCKGWALSRAYLAKLGIKLYGFRVVEPHHDGTPHWHMVIFFENPANAALVRATLKKYALREDGAEFGAAEHRFKAEKIDRSKGSAAGYLAKYISKNINAKGVEDETDFEGGSLGDNARRVDAWASCWGIRQFQQIGGAPVGVWRELRRLGSVTDTDTGILSRLQDAADNADWHLYTALMGGALVSRKGLTARVRRVWFDNAITRYDGEGMEKIEGVESCVSDEFEKTRLRAWVLKRAFAPAWSSVNNCNQPIERTGIERKPEAVFSSLSERYFTEARWSALPARFWSVANIDDERGFDGYKRSNEENKGGAGWVGGGSNGIESGGHAAKGAKSRSGARAS